MFNFLNNLDFYILKIRKTNDENPMTKGMPYSQYPLLVLPCL